MILILIKSKTDFMIIKFLPANNVWGDLIKDLTYLFLQKQCCFTHATIGEISRREHTEIEKFIYSCYSS